MVKKGFFWGNSISSMQTEGAWNEDGKGMSVYDIKEPSEFQSDWRVAIDSYHRYEEDFDIYKDLGMNMLRFQISWSRVNPEGDGDFNQKGIDFYDKFIDGLIERGIEPMICLYHYDMPLNLAKRYNGFIDKRVVEAFIRFGKKMIDTFGHKVKYWMTFNEQNLFFLPDCFKISGYLNGKKTTNEFFQIQHNTTYAHACIANYLHEKTNGFIGGHVTFQEVYPSSSHPKDVILANDYDMFVNMDFLNLTINGKHLPSVEKFIEENINIDVTEKELEEISKVMSDYILLSYYFSTTIDHRTIPDNILPHYYLEYGKKDNPFIDTSDFGWQIDAPGFKDILKRVYNRFQIPVFPIENGLGAIEEWDGENPINDQYRIDYHREHIKAMFEAIDEGVDVLGYLGWGLIDILSSQGDMRKRYGVVYVNRTNHDLRDLKRVPKKSYYWLKKVFHSNGKDLD